MGQSLTDGDEAVREASEEPRTVVVAKFGVVYAFRGRTDDARDLPAVIEDVGKALKADNRVRVVHVPDAQPGWDRELSIFPEVDPSDADEAYGEADVLRGFRLLEPFRFTFDIPRRNQPSDDGFIPERYCVAWDGAVAVITWVQDDAAWTATAAGLAALSLLHDILHKADLHLHPQRCDEDCSYPFLHRSVRVLPGDDGDVLDWSDEDMMGLELIAETADVDPEALADEYHGRLGTQLWAFAELKNVSRRVLGLERAVREQGGGALKSHAEVMQHRAMGLRAQARALRTTMGVRHRLHRQLARVWWGLAALNAMYARWELERVEFERMVEDPRAGLLYVIDTKDQSVIEHQNLDLLVTAVEQASARLDTRAVATAGVWGAMAGIVAGVIITIAFS